jgi:ATP-dependent Lhr-like helicase
MLADPESWRSLPAPVRDWLEYQQTRSQLPSADEVLIETFPHAKRYFMVAYPFEGRLAHQTLGMLLTRRLERECARPLGFVATDYALSVWGFGDVGAMIEGGRIDLDALFDSDMLGDDLDAWLAESSLMKRTFRLAAVIAGLIEKRSPGREKSGRQVTVSTDLIYDVLRRHEPDHLLIEAAWADARTRLTDVGRVADVLERAAEQIVHVRLDRVSPLAVPVLVMIGRESLPAGAADEDLLLEAESLAGEAMRMEEAETEGD